MMDGGAAGAAGGGGQAGYPCQDLYKDYLSWYLQQGPEARPGQDSELHKKAARFLRGGQAELARTFTLLPFQQAVAERCGGGSAGCRRHLTAFIRAAEVLETICVNLFLQPWRKEIKTLKTFTGAYVYCLLPVFSSSTLQSVLASIGYLPHNDASQSEFRLSADADPKTAMQLGFELLLARVLCYNVLDLLLEDQLGPQEWLEALQRREQPAKETDHTEKKTVLDDMKDNEEKKDKEEVSVDLESGPASKPQPKPRCYHLSSVDQSVMEMQRIYPDLAFRGRPLMTEQLHRAHGATGSKKVPHQAAVSKRDSIRGSQAGAPTLLSRDDFSKVDKSAGISERTSGSAEENDGRSTTTSDASATDENRVDDGLSGPQAISLYITLRAGSKVKPRLKPEKPPSIEEDPAETQHPGGENVRVARQEFQSSSSGDEEQELRELSERMGHLHVREDKAEAKRTKREEGARGERRQKERGAVKPNLKTQEMEMNEVVGHDPGRYAKSSQPDWMLGSEQSQPSVLTESSADCLSCRGVQEGKGSGRDPKGQAEEKQVTLC